MGQKEMSKELNNKEWLHDEYVKKQNSAYKISHMLGVTVVTVIKYLKKHGIKTEKRLRRPNSYDKLNDKEWLTEQYQRRSAAEIAKDLKCAIRYVTQALKKLGIKERNALDRSLFRDIDRRCEMDIESKNAKNVLEGSLLGDASLRLQPCGKTARFSKTNKNYDHILFVAKQLFGTNAEKRIKKIRGYFCVSSFCEIKLTNEYKRWYKNEKKLPHELDKIVPPDLELNAQKILHWFLDDGNSSWNKNKKTSAVKLHTEGFELNGIDNLVNKLAELGIVSKVCSRKKKRKSGETMYYIKIDTEHTYKFFEVIGPCPEDIKSMNYKWKIPTEKPRTISESMLKLRDKAWLKNEYITRKNSLRTIGKLLGCNGDTVREWCIKHEIELRPLGTNQTTGNPCNI